MARARCRSCPSRQRLSSISSPSSHSRVGTRPGAVHCYCTGSCADICQLGGVCRHLYAVTHCEAVWQLQVVRQYMVYWAGELDSLQAGLAEERRPLVATVCDPTLQGNREMAIIYSPQFRRIMIERNARTKQVCREAAIAG